MKREIDTAMDMAKEKLSEIHTVSEWADRMGYKRSRLFSSEFQHHYGKRPLTMLNDLKLDHAIRQLRSKHKVLHYEIAKSIGLSDEQAFYKFIKFHTGRTPSHFKRKKRSGLINAASF